jgi:hypothetical protein
VTVSLNGATTVQTFAVGAAQALKFNFSSDHPNQVNRIAAYDSHIDTDNFTIQNQNGENLEITTNDTETAKVKLTGTYAYTEGTATEPESYDALPDTITLGAIDKVGSIICDDRLTRDEIYGGKIIWVHLAATLANYVSATYD